MKKNRWLTAVAIHEGFSLLGTRYTVLEYSIHSIFLEYGKEHQGKTNSGFRPLRFAVAFKPRKPYQNVRFISALVPLLLRDGQEAVAVSIDPCPLRQVR